MHEWGDEGVDWQGIGEAAEYIGHNLVKWGRVGVTDIKEKYGTARVYCHFGWHNPHCVTHPRYVYCQYPKWLWKLCYTRPVLALFNLLNYVVIPIQMRLYTYFYGKAIRKWPKLRLEILSGADHHELLSKYGVHVIQTGKQSATIMYDWHPDNSQDVGKWYA